MENANQVFLHNQTLEPKKQRNASFELLRVLCMILIISTHFLGHGGWIHNMTGANLVFGKLLQSLFYPSVNLYVMIGAYFMCNSTSSKVNLKKLAKLCGTVFFYSMLMFAISMAVGMYEFDVKHLLSSIFPLITGKYWFFTSYVVLLIASPFLNIIIRGVNTKQLACICAVFIVAGGIQAETGVLPQFPLAGGCNGIWFVGVYFIAALIRRTDFKFTKTTGIIAILLYLGTLVYGYFVHTSHSSFMCVLSTVIIFVFFKELKIKDANFAKFVCALSPLTFGVYLIHDSNEMRGYMYQNIFHAYKFYDHQVAFIILFGFILLTFVVCATFEFGRHKIAQLLSPSFNKLLDNLGNKIKAKVETYKAKKLSQ